MTYEKLGAFYLGREVDADREPTDDLLLYDAKDLTTHAVVVGMTGSGKTGLSVGLLEEAAIDGVPALVIDPKGDLGNLMLTFPDLSPSDFEPWIDPAEATRKGRSVAEHAAATATLWRDGLASWNQKPERIRRFRDAVDIAIYTPGSTAGRSLRALRSLSAPPEAVRDDTDALKDRIQTSVSGLLALLGIAADPIRSREHILLSNLLDRAWREGRDLDLTQLIGEIQNPPFDKLGVLDLESFFPGSARLDLALQINNLLASPGFEAWMEGEPLDIGKLLYRDDGKPRISILSIAHLSDAERMFVVTLVLNELVAWMRSQPGTSSLRALLYMDEIFGYFPPSAMPPSKLPMLTLLKQARAFGVGVVLATQNPVDLDYKGLSNCGTWFIGRLQTERDKARVLEGLEGASAASGSAIDPAALGETIGSLGKRVFLMNNVHEDAPVLFQTRWVLSYLRGPLTREQIRQLSPPESALEATEATAAEPAPPEPESAPATQSPGAASRRPKLPKGVAHRFVPLDRDSVDGREVLYRPELFASCQLHFKRLTYKIDDWLEKHLAVTLYSDDTEVDWDSARGIDDPRWEKRAVPGARYAPLPDFATDARTWSSIERALKTRLYREETLEIYRHAALKLVSAVGESEVVFRQRVALASAEKRDLLAEKLKKKYEGKFAVLKRQILSAEQRVDREGEQYRNRRLSTAVSFGQALLGAVMGRKLGSSTNVSRASRAMRDMSRSRSEKEDIARAQEKLGVLLERREALETEFEAAAAALDDSIAPDQIDLEVLELRPTKSDIAVESKGILWTPWRRLPDGALEPLVRR